MNRRLADLSQREFATFLPLLILAVWMGLYPAPFLRRLDTSVQRIVARVSPQYASPAAAIGGNSAPATQAAGPVAAAGTR